MPEGNKHIEVFPELEKLSIEELEALLRLDIQTSGDQEPDMDYIMSITEVISKREAEKPNYEPPDLESAWQKFKETNNLSPGEELYTPLHHNSTGGDRQKSRRGFLLLGRIASAALVSSLLIGVLLTSVSGVNILSMLVKWSSETFAFISNEENPGEDIPTVSNNPFETLRATVAEHTKTPVVPNWCPEGTTEQKVQALDRQDSIRIRASYLLNGSEFNISITIYDKTPDTYDTTYEKDNASVVEYNAGGVKHYMMSNLDNKKVVWKRDNLECSISGPFSKEELEKMVDSIYKE